MSDSKTEVGVEDVSIADAGVEETEIVETQETVEEPETIPEPGVEDADPQEPESGEETGESEEESEAYEEVEFDFGGKKFAIGKNEKVDAVAGELQNFAKSLESDWTQKTQAVAEQRKSLEAQTEAINELSSLNEDAMGLYSDLHFRKSQLDAYGAKPTEYWEQLRAEDPDRYSQEVADRNFHQMEYQRIQQSFDQKKQEISNTQSRQRDRFMAEGKKQVQNKIKGFTDAKAAELVDYVVENHGVPREQAEEWPLNPVGTIMAYESMLYRKMQDNLKTAKKPKVKPAVPVPATKTGSRSRKKTYAEMSMEEFAKVRDAEDAAG